MITRMGADLPTGFTFLVCAPTLLFVARRDCLFAAPFYASREPDAYPAKRRSTIDALCPPKPDEFETATLTSALRASFGT
jgi:hypothetical protein